MLTSFLFFLLLYFIFFEGCKGKEEIYDTNRLQLFMFFACLKKYLERMKKKRKEKFLTDFLYIDILARRKRIDKLFFFLCWIPLNSVCLLWRKFIRLRTVEEFFYFLLDEENVKQILMLTKTLESFSFCTF